MRVEAVELRVVSMPLVSPFRTSFGTELVKDALLVKVTTDVGEGWGECVAMAEPVYSSEYLTGSAEVLRRFLIPAVTGNDVTAEDVAALTEFVVGHRMAKGALEMALLDAQLRAVELSLAAYLGAERDWVPSGVSVGIHDSVPELLDSVERYLADGYRRIKLKIEPGNDIEPVRAVRERFGDDLPLQVDANTAYTLADAEHLAQLDDFGLLLIEQPFAEEDLMSHAGLSHLISTPVCLDESIVSVDTAEQAISLSACSVINIKAGRVGGYLEALRIHDLAAAEGVPVWCGGMVETGLGRAANVALAALPNFTLPGDTSASDRFFTTDDGGLDVPTRPGIGATPIPEILDDLTVHTEVVTPE
jgi:o-succinylbenzoate synthase